MSLDRGMWLTTSADPARAIPRSAAERQWQIEAALVSMRHEEQRLDRLGLEQPIARCHQQRRFWEFVRAIDAMGAMGPMGSTDSKDSKDSTGSDGLGRAA